MNKGIVRRDSRHYLRRRRRLDGARFADVFAHGYQLLRRRRETQALQVFRGLSDVSPRDRPVQLMLACCLAATGDDARCRETVAEALNINADNQLVDRIGRAMDARADGRWRESATLLAEAACLRSDLPTVILILGDVLEQLNLTEEANYAWGLSLRHCQCAPHLAHCARQRLCVRPR